jgi:hypothetical protein
MPSHRRAVDFAKGEKPYSTYTWAEDQPFKDVKGFLLEVTDMALVWTLCAILLSWLAALAFRIALNWSDNGRAIGWSFCSLSIGLAPCFVPLTCLPCRLAAAMVAIALLVKLYDLFRNPLLAKHLSTASYSLYLANWFWLVLKRIPPTVPANRDLKHLWLTLSGLLAVAGICIAVFARDYSRVPFALEHSLKVTVVVTAVILLTNASSQGWRLLDGRALEPMRNSAMAGTPADFWRRWNRPAQQFFYKYIFRHSGGARNPVRGVMLTFMVSGLVHEYVFGIATGRVQGWQFLYFVLNGIASLVTMRIRPRGWTALPAVEGTVIFNLTMAVLFFKSVNSVFPFYSPRVG